MLYPRLRSRYSFVNVKKLFAEVLHWVNYSVNIYGTSREICFDSMSYLYSPSTIDASYNCHDSSTKLEGMKNDHGEWNTDGHINRVIKITIEQLKIFSSAFDEGGVSPRKAKLPSIYSTEVLKLIEKVSTYPEKAADNKGFYQSERMWDEDQQQKTGYMIRNTSFPVESEDLVLSGPNIYLANAFYKTPDEVCENQHNYTPIDLEEIPCDYLPRGNFKIISKEKEKVPQLNWSDKRVTDNYRLAFRAMLSQPAERTLVSAIVPPGVEHINGLRTISAKTDELLLRLALTSYSIVGDAYIKVLGRTNLHGTWAQLPLCQLTSTSMSRVLALTCITSHYDSLWQRNFPTNQQDIQWGSSNPILKSFQFFGLSKNWSRESALRSDFTRRQAIVEIDVLVARDSLIKFLSMR